MLLILPIWGVKIIKFFIYNQNELIKISYFDTLYNNKSYLTKKIIIFNWFNFKVKFSKTYILMPY